MKRILFSTALILALIITCSGRLNETVEQVEARYGKPIEPPKTEAGPSAATYLYETNGFRIAVRFQDKKSCYESFRKLDPQNPKRTTDMSATERETILKANAAGFAWSLMVTNVLQNLFVPQEHFERTDNKAKAKYDSQSKALSIWLADIQKVDEQKRAEQELQKLKGF